MQPEIPKWLEDIRDCAAYIVTATQNETVESYETNRTLRQAVERNFEIIGEALNRISRTDPGVAERLCDYRQIISFRNILIHGYDHIDLEIVWRVIKGKVPELLRTVEELLRGVNGDEA